jgi:1-deoxyxylulose-5-phosphate synthase
VEYVNLGNTGVKVSRLCLGCMTFGEPDRGSRPWTLSAERSFPIIRQALESGINFLDTANSYSDGSSEEIVGRAIKEFGRRDEIVLATKVYNRVRPGPNGMGLSRKAIFTEIDASLCRLQTDYVDLYQIHRWDYNTPIEETLEALHDVVKSGKVRYLGASSMYAWQFSKAMYLAALNRWTPFVAMQNHYNLLYREEEREMLPLCVDQGVAMIPWSPLARGRLARDVNSSTKRLETDDIGRQLYAQSANVDNEIIRAVGEVALRRGVSRAQVALAWLLDRQPVTAAIVGTSTSQHLTEALGALSIRLDSDDRTCLEKPYQPHAIAGFQ